MTLLEQCVGFVMVFAFIVLALWQRNAFIYIMVVPVTMIFGLAMAVDYDIPSPFWFVGITIAVFGTYFLFRVAVNELLSLLRRARKEKL